MFRIMVVFFFVSGCVLLCPKLVSATMCRCHQHSAESEAEGACSRTEDEKQCSLVFTPGSKALYSRLSQRLRKRERQTGAKEALYQFSILRPEELGEEFVTDLLPALFEVSQKDKFPRFSSAISRILRSKDFQRIGQIMLSPEYLKTSKHHRIDDFSVTVSYGCIEFQQGTFFSMVKTQWSRAIFYCDDFQEE